jgi:hypothetical protein
MGIGSARISLFSFYLLLLWLFVAGIGIWCFAERFSDSNLVFRNIIWFCSYEIT